MRGCGTTLVIPDRVGRTGYGPGAGSYSGEELDAAHHPEAHAHGK